MHNLKLSIIIPVYNVEEYVEKCIRSCAEQDLDPKDYEIIVINDGSPDGSLAICENLVAEYRNIRLISQKNKGLSGARNTGFQEAMGEYVWFVDSDDWLSPSVLTNICSKLGDSLDLLWLGHVVEKDHQIISSSVPMSMVKYCSGQRFYTNHVNSENYIWKFIYRRAFLIKYNLFFYEGIFYEDFEFTPRALAVAKKCLTFPQVAYNYIIRNDSIVGNIKAKHIKDRIWVCKQNLNFLASTNLDLKFELNLKDKIACTVISCADMVARNNLQFPEIFEDLLKSLKCKDTNSKLKQMKLCLLKLNTKAYRYAYNISLRLFR